MTNSAENITLDEAWDRVSPMLRTSTPGDAARAFAMIMQNYAIWTFAPQHLANLIVTAALAANDVVRYFGREGLVDVELKYYAYLFVSGRLTIPDPGE